MSAQLDKKIHLLLLKGTVIPAHPLALKSDYSLDEFRQRRLTRYYIAAGAGGIAIGVHTTQFEIRRPDIKLYEPVLKMASEEIHQSDKKDNLIKVAGITGDTKMAIREAELSVKYGYHLGLLSNGGLESYSEDDLIERAYEVSRVIPLFGFYLQPAAGGRVLSYDFWRKFADIPNVYAIKIAAFNRYQTIDVIRAVCHSDRRDEIALYTGNDDNIIADLLTTYPFVVNGQKRKKKFAGGLLGHWAVWTSSAVQFLNDIKAGSSIEKLLAKGVSITEMNAVIFDVENNFRGCIPGIHEILRRQGLLEGNWCLDPNEKLSASQSQKINRIIRDYPHLMDDDFVKIFLKNDS